MESWYGVYCETLEAAGWVVQEYGFHDLAITGATASVDKAVLDILAAIVLPGQAPVAQAVLESLRALADGDDERFRLFEKNTYHASGGSFQLGIASAENGLVAMRAACLHFRISETGTTFLWWNKQTTATSLRATAHELTLNESVYAQVREVIAERLGSAVVAFVKEIPLSIPR